MRSCTDHDLDGNRSRWLARGVVVASLLLAASAIGQPRKDDKKPAGAGSASAAGAGAGSATTPTPPTPTTGAGVPGATGTTGTGGAPTDGAAEPAEQPSDAPADAGEIDTLRQEYLKLRDELFASRARAATVAGQLYSSKLSIRLTYTTGRYYGVSRASVRLDGASVYDNSEGAISGDDAVRFEGFVAPGRHVITFRVEARGKDDERFATSLEDTITVQAVAGKDLVVAARAKDGGDVAYAWKKKEAGTYRLGLDVDVKAVARPDAGATGGKGKKAAAAPPLNQLGARRAHAAR
ncbi:MAG: hypothetical protein KA297_01225 [Kofleriaceae bacterium]|jgi:hypothetical protein|nr:hypothetical protein [Kofleriaceae bacterium]MBP6836676.1 hypothetical protein [Kofleriaceae bacterium]